jgi:hypothetical protein
MVNRIIYFGYERVKLLGIPERIPMKQLLEICVEGELNYLGLDFEFWRGPGESIIRAYAIKKNGNVHIADYDPKTGKRKPEEPSTPTDDIEDFPNAA